MSVKPPIERDWRTPCDWAIDVLGSTSAGRVFIFEGIYRLNGGTVLGVGSAMEQTANIHWDCAGSRLTFH